MERRTDPHDDKEVIMTIIVIILTMAMVISSLTLCCSVRSDEGIITL